MKFLIWAIVRRVKSIVLYEYTNKEKDIIEQAFRIGNF